MSSLAKYTRATIVPALLYRDAASAVDWLCTAFGLEQKVVYKGDDGTVMHAELIAGNGMIMCGQTNDRAWGRLIKQPEEIDGYGTQGLYVVVTDADAMYERAKAAGAEIVIDIQTQDYGGRDFTCRDIEGHLWSFGTYDPWESH